MMYIEHTNLEDNLHQILTNRIPTSSSPSASEAAAAVATSALLARVREAQNIASVLRQTQQTTSSELQFLHQHHRDNSSTPNNDKTATKDCLRRPEPNLLPLTHFNSNDIVDLNKVSVTHNNTSVSKSEQVQKVKFHLQKSVAKPEEEEEEQYELLQIIDADQTAQVETLKILQSERNVPQGDFSLTSHFVNDLKHAQKITSTGTTLPIQQKVQVDEDEEFEYVVTRVPKKNFRKSAVSQTIQDYTILNHKLRRPVPEAIPIDFHQKVESYNGHQATKEPPSLLPAPQHQAAIKNLRKYSIESEEYCNRTRELNGYVNPALYIENDNHCDYYSESETVEVASTGRPVYVYNKNLVRRHEDQMGLDIISKIKNLFNWNQSTRNQYSTVQQEGKRKRRSDDWCVNEEINPQQIKYRKVENNFPKYISALSDDDVNVILPPLSSYNQQQQRKEERDDKQYLLKSSAQNARTLLEMSNRRSTSTDKPPLRKSMFSSPHITQQLIKNTTYADVEFSDDEEPIIFKGLENKASSLNTVKRIPEVFNIPFLRNDDRVKPIKQKLPPPLLEPSTGNILQSSLKHELENRRKPTYAETLRQSGATGYVLGGHSSVSSSVASTSESSRIMNGIIGQRSNYWPTPNRSSILNQEKQCEDREKYQQLLEQLVPRLYGSTVGDNKFLSYSSNSLAQRTRANLLLNTAITSSSRSSSAAKQRSMGIGKSLLKRPPLSSTINLDDDDDDDDVTICGTSHLKSARALKAKQSMPTTVILDDDDDDDISDILGLANEERHMLSACAKIQKEENSINFLEQKVEKPRNYALPYVEPVNSLKERFNSSPIVKENWLENFQSKWLQRKKNRHDQVRETVKATEKLTAERRAAEAEIQERLRKFQIVDPELVVVDDFDDIVEEPEFVEMTQKHRARLNAALCGPLDQTLVSKFNLNITRRDIHTLCGHNWLNDEVINFYMNLLTDRGENKHESHGLPKVYAMNTFFVPRLMQAGHAGVKRWTRKVDIFEKDIMPVPVHVGGVHWCMAIIHLKNRTIKYYDSMGTPNPSVLKALEQYLKDESMDKRKRSFDTSDFVIESVQGVPRQMNGSDCGVFSCMFAEYITRNREITFSQQNMEYFRQKMVLEIVMGELLQ